jgi:hypothetical protein
MVKKNKNKKINDNDDFDKIIEEFKHLPSKKPSHTNHELFEQELKNMFPTYTIINLSNKIKSLNDLRKLLNELNIDNITPTITIRFLLELQPNKYTSELFDKGHIDDSILVVFINSEKYIYNTIDGALLNIKRKIEGVECCVCFDSDIQRYLNCVTCGTSVCSKCNDDIISYQLSNNKLCCPKCKHTLRCPICNGIDFILNNYY